MAQIRVDDAEQRRRRDFEAGDNGRAESEFPGAMDDTQPPRPRQIIGERACAVGGVVIDDDELERDARAVARLEQPAHQLGQPVALVVGGNDHRDVGRRERCHPSTIIPEKRVTWQYPRFLTDFEARAGDTTSRHATFRVIHAV